ncbi:hypothetical protein BRAS3809_1570015 [Bradyrhizobium sp. STM 3809]|nr:hypothetical protein BRAS3809_1570015 [Bradyrhizobium sp. STM 3809]
MGLGILDILASRIRKKGIRPEKLLAFVAVLFILTEPAARHVRGSLVTGRERLPSQFTLFFARARRGQWLSCRGR